MNLLNAILDLEYKLKAKTSHNITITDFKVSETTISTAEEAKVS